MDNKRQDKDEDILSALSKLNNSLVEIVQSNKKPFYKNGNFILPTLLSIVALLQTQIIGCQQQQIENFDVLLKNTREQVDGLNKQTLLLSNNAKPLLKDVDYQFVSVPGEAKNLVTFHYLIRNFGQTPAYNLDPSVFFIRVVNGYGVSHSAIRPADFEKYQNTIYPGEQKQYSTRTTFSEKGILDLVEVVAVCRFVYFDKTSNKLDTSIFYYEHTVDVKNNSYSIGIAKPESVKIVTDYLHFRNL